MNQNDDEGDFILGQSIYFTSEQLFYLNKLADSFHVIDAEDEGAFDEARVMNDVQQKVFNAVQKERKTMSAYLKNQNV